MKSATALLTGRDVPGPSAVSKAFRAIRTEGDCATICPIVTLTGWRLGRRVA